MLTPFPDLDTPFLESWFALERDSEEMTTAAIGMKTNSKKKILKIPNVSERVERLFFV